MFLHICFVSLCVCGRVSLQRRANIEVTGIYKKTAKTAVFYICRSSLFFLGSVNSLFFPFIHSFLLQSFLLLL